MQLYAKLLLLLLMAISSHGDTVILKDSPCPFEKALTAGEWKLGHENMHPDFARINIPLKKEIGDIATYTEEDATEPYLACKGRDCCYNRKYICGFNKLQFFVVSHRPAKENCDVTTGLLTKVGCPTNYDCHFGACCPTAEVKKQVADAQCPKDSRLSVPLQESNFCNGKCPSANQFCFNVFDGTTEFAKYYTLDEGKRKQYKTHCCEHDAKVTHCPLGTFPALQKNEKFTVDAEKDLTCPDKYYKTKSLTGSGFTCCPTVAADYKDRLTVVLDTTKQDARKIKECSDDSSCGEKELCLKSYLYYDSNLAYGKKFCYPFPKCASGEDAQLVPKSSKPALQQCDNSEMCPGDKPMFCQEKAICCPLNCPYNEKKVGNEPAVVLADNGVCTKGLLLYDHPLLQKICCRVDQDKMCPDGQLPVLPNAKNECQVNSKKSKDGRCCYVFRSKDLIGIETEGTKSCAEHKECKESTEFCGESQFSKGLEQHLIGSPSHCYPRPSYKNADPKIGPKTSKKGLESCTKDADCDGTIPSECADIVIGQKKGSGKICFYSQCPFDVPLKDKTQTCKENTDCKSKTTNRVDGGCFNLLGSEKHCCRYTDSYTCPGGVFPVPAEDGTPFGTCDKTARKMNIGDQQVCCPKLSYDIPKHYKNDTSITEKTISLENYDKKCIEPKDCAKDEFCGTSSRDGLVYKSEVLRHCYKKPMCDGDYPSSEHFVNSTPVQLMVPVRCKVERDCTAKSISPQYCSQKDEICCKITTEMCPYYTQQVRDSPLLPCKDDDCIHFPNGIHRFHCVNIPRIGKRCCDTDSDKLCPHEQPIGLHNFTKIPEGECESIGMYSYGPIKYCCRYFQYAGIDKHLPPVSRNDSMPGEGGKEMTCKNHTNCDGENFCGSGVFSTKQKGFISRPNPAVSFCFPLPTIEKGEAMKTDTTGLQFCKTNAECKGADDIVVCAKAKVESGEVTTTTMCFQKKCPFGLKSLAPTGTCSTHGECSSNSICTPIGSTKHCCPVDDAHLCYQKQFPIVKGENEKCPDGTVKHPNPTYTTLCCSRFISIDYGTNNTVFAASDEKECSDHKQCTNDKFCGNSTFAYDSGPQIKPAKHCYPRPVFEGVAASLKGDVEGIQTCDTGASCKAENPVICTNTSLEGKPIDDLMFCFEKACSFGDKPSKPSATCAAKKDCLQKEFCVQTFSSFSHCCKTDNNNIICPTGEPPVMGEKNNPHGNCNSTISVQQEIDKKKYCCPLMVHYYGKSNITTDGIRPPCSASSDCKPDEFCGESARIDNQPMLKSAKHCYKRPICWQNKDEVKYALLRNDALISCTDSINCNGLMGDQPHHCQNEVCCELKCPYWSKVVAPHGVSDCSSTSTCPQDSQCTALQVFKAKKCCHVDDVNMCPGDQLPVLVKDEAPSASQCPDGSVTHPKVKGVCCASFQSVDVFDKENKPAAPDDGFTFCRTHNDCNAKDEFCGYSEVTKDTMTKRGKLAHCYKVPTQLPKNLRPTLLRTVGLFSCKTAADCTEATGPVLCDNVNKVSGKGFCYELPCPFDVQAKNATATCTDHKACDSDSLCTSVHQSVKHCCPVGKDFRCPLFQLPYMQSEAGCKDGSVAHSHKPDVCCQHFIYKDFAPSSELKTATNDKECLFHSECSDNEFCGDSELSKMSERIQGPRRHCYLKPNDAKNVPASTDTEVNLLMCKSDQECKTTNPATCTEALINKKPIPGVKMCFEKQCPYGAPPLDSQKTCKSDAECESGSLCTHVTGTASHCCPVADEFKCYGSQLPYVTPNAGAGCKDGSVKRDDKSELCCQKFILKAFGEATPHFALNPSQECGAHMDCQKDEFCGESVLFKMADKLFGAPKHCYKKPKFDEMPAMVNKYLGLTICTDASQCQATHPVVCEGFKIDGTDVKGLKACFEKPCPLGGTTKAASISCSSHGECSTDNSLCLPVFTDLQTKYCCKPDNKHRCYGSQLPYVVEGSPIDQCKDGAEAKNGYCCQYFLSKTLKEEAKATSNNQECTSHKQCREDEFCGPSTLSKMDSMVIGAPNHCFKIPTLDDKNGVKAMLKKTVGILTCTSAAECSPFATHAVVCKEAKGVNLCFEKQCPFGATPADPAETCVDDGGCNRALCTNVIGTENHCCPVESSLKCFNTQLPYQKGKTECKDENGVDHPQRKELCCRKFINRLLGDENAVFAKMNDKECGSDKDCEKDEFCGESTVYKMDSLLIGNPKHCYPRPQFEESTPVLNERGLVKCNDEKDCGTTNPTICGTGTIAGKEIKGLKICYEKLCPFGEPSNSSLFCQNHSGCTDEVCSKVFTSSKHCCPIGPDFTCHDSTPFPQFPYIKDDAKECEDGSGTHPRQPHLCCQKFTYKGFGETAIFEPIDQKTTCESEKDCKEGEFCGDSTLLKMETRGAPKHCYTRPVLDGNVATLFSGELVACQEPTTCPGEKVSTCDAPTLPSGALSGVSICYEADCPLWPVGTAIDRTKSVICKGQTQCGDFDKEHCVNLYKKEKHCCPVDKNKLCHGGVLPLLDKSDKVLTNCDAKLNYQNTVGEDKFCCDTPISMKYHEVGVEQESQEVTKICTKNAECDKGFFCGLSATKSGKTAFENNMKHCYKEPTGAGGILREDGGSDITPCDSHEQCQKSKGEYCNKELGKEYKKGICHLAKCPLAKALTKNTYVTCKSNTECGSELCHPISGLERGCCTIDDGNYCPSGLIPPTVGEKSCDKTHFEFKANGVDVCCRKLISKTLNAAGTKWALLKTDDIKLITKAMDDSQCSDKKACNDRFYCDVSDSLDASIVEKQVKHCYPVPETYGSSVVGPPAKIKTCKDSKDCDGGNGETCDMLLHKLDDSISPSTGVCSKFFCPLSPLSPVSRPPSFKSGTSVCDKLDECSSDNKECHPVGISETVKGCCGVDKEFLCPGGVFPRRFINKMNSNVPFLCDDNTLLYKEGDNRMQPGDEARCCPEVISRDVYQGAYDGANKYKHFPRSQDAICGEHGDCNAEEFCGESMLLEDFVSGKELRVNGKKVNHCYEKPKCSGTTVLLKDTGLKICTKASDTCGANEVCDFGLSEINDQKFDGTGVCCHYECKRSYPEIADSDLGTAGKICDDCEDATEENVFCDIEAKGNETEIKICEKTETPGKYRLCTYKRDPASCPGGLGGPMRLKNSHDLVGCNHEVECRDKRNNAVDDVLIRPRCAAPTKELKHLSFPKICCKADLCSDMFTDRKNEKECQKDDECRFMKFRGKCEQDSFGKDNTTHCCPNAEPEEASSFSDVSEPYLTNMTCTKLEDCMGERRFCDPVTEQCMYHYRTLQNYDKVDKTCTKEDKDCGEKRIVCMTTELGNDPQPPTCYMHPLDECRDNSYCKENEEYCAPEIGTNETEYDLEFRKCHKAPPLAKIDPEQVGLRHCKNTADCKSRDLICDISLTNLALKPGFGFCKSPVEIKCRGIPSITYVRGEVSKCKSNADCEQSTHFCDVNIEKGDAWAKEEGICCSKPTDCAGESSSLAVGLKICKDDASCDSNDGEICDKDITKPDGSNWKTEEGVCCKMNCPKSEKAEAIKEDFVPAGAVCQQENCQSDDKAFKSCVSPSNNVTKQRCCSYKRRESLCPADTVGVVRDGLDARQCNSTEDCPAKAACIAGWCCKQSFCADGFTLKMKQTICSENTVDADCAQPTGASATCEDGHCCPTMYGEFIQKPFLTDFKCDEVSDCPRHMMYCHDQQGLCVHFGSRTDLKTDKPCESDNATCPEHDGLPGVCVFPDSTAATPVCFTDPLAQKVAKPQALKADEAEEDYEKSKAGLIIGIVAVIIGVLTLIALGLFIYFKFTQRRTKKRKEEAARKALEEKEKSEKQGSEVSAREPSNKEEEQKLPDVPIKPNCAPLAPQFIAL